jgi:type II secretory pathway component PulF
MIVAATEEKLPLVPLLESWGADERGIQRLRVRRLVDLLDKGSPLSEALEEIPGILLDEDILAVRFDSQSGTRTAAMQARLKEGLPHSPAIRSVRQTLIYFAVVVPVALAIAGFLQASIVPIFRRILQEYQTPPPDVMRYLIEIAGRMTSLWWVAVLGILGLLWISLSASAARWVRGVTSRWFARWRDWYAADVLQKLAVTLAAGRPVAGALSTLARYHFDPTIRHKLLFVRNEVEQGFDIWPSLATVGLLTSAEVRVLATAQRVGNRPWALHQLVAHKRQQTMRSWERLSIFLLPALVLVLGGFVLAQALLIFQPLIEIVRAL